MEHISSKWLISNAIVMGIALLLAINTQSLFWLSLVALISFCYLFYEVYKYNDSRKLSAKNTNPCVVLPFLGSYANQITAFRFLLSAIISLIVFQLPEMLNFCLFSLAIGLDGLDGYLARKHQQMSQIGALFDKTVDAYFVLLLSFILVLQYDIPLWFLGIGYLHYGYELLIYGLGWQDLKVPQNPIGKYAAAFLFISLLSPFILPIYLSYAIIYVAAFFVSCSFGISFFYKLKAAYTEV